MDDGRPIREALEASGLSIPQLAERTREVDPGGVGISQALVGFYASTGRSARETASERTARLIADALNVEVSTIFATNISP
ncbi:helix-turn-helix domain-containing protein [Streptomyces xiamenensis]